MSIAAVLRFVGVLLMWIALAMLPPAALSVGEGLLAGWIGSIGVTAALGAGLFFGTSGDGGIDHRAGLVIVGLGWLAVVTVGSLPFVFTGMAPPVEAFFESASGFTTTGATVFAAVHELPQSILLWRSLSHWLGGMGIIVLGVAILPFLGVGGAQLFRAEAPGISTDRLRPRIASTARLLWTVYAILTAALAALYLAAGMSLFEAVNHAMSTLATGGFSTRTESMAAFSPTIQWITTAFMVIAGTNFALHYRFATGRWDAWIRDVEWRVYVLVLLAAAAFCYAVLAGSGGSWGADGLRAAAFNVVAVMTTTGFATDDFALWPVVCQVVLLGLMFVGAMGGSTGGGLKVVRAVVMARHTATRFRLVLHPKAVVLTRLGARPVRPEVLLHVVELFTLYLGTHALGTLILAALGYDFVTSVSAALAAMSSIGPGLGSVVGPAGHYGDLSAPAHMTLSALMLLGRLEFYTLLILLFPETWIRAFDTDSRRRTVSLDPAGPT